MERTIRFAFAALSTILMLALPSLGCNNDEFNCGDSACNVNVGESCSTCSADCGICTHQGRCGDGMCDSAAGETCATCPNDCGTCTNRSGNGYFNTYNGVGPYNGVPPYGYPYGSVGPYGGLPSYGYGSPYGSLYPYASGAACGDGACNDSENCANCPNDCGTCTSGYGGVPYVGGIIARNAGCGDGICRLQLGENCANCPRDCGVCGHSYMRPWGR